MTLNVLIPTYNRSKALSENLNELKAIVLALVDKFDIEIIISNNHSTDDSHEMIRSFISHNPQLKIRYYSQDRNIGLEQNALFVLEKATSDFIMFLGDDDFIKLEYLKNALIYLEGNPDISCVIPNYVPVNNERKQIAAGRDDHLRPKVFPPGFRSCLINSWRGHQLSGLILKREGLLEVFKNQKVSNIYLFIFFVAHTSLQGGTFHLTSYPVQVTQPGQSNKDWGYGQDGLLNQVFDNYKKLDLSLVKKSLLQIYFFQKQSWRLWIYFNNRTSFFKALLRIWFSENSTLIFKIIFPFQVIIQSILMIKGYFKRCSSK